MKIGDLVYESDGITIVYEEKELINDTPSEITLNKLGEPDTVLTVIVTAEDGVNKNEYQIVIKRPYGTIKGTIKYDEIEENENDSLNKVTNLSFYNQNQINWKELEDFFGFEFEDPITFTDLDSVEKAYFTTSDVDGSYEVRIIPGTYDFQIERLGFLNYIITNIEVTEGAEIDLSEKTLIAGDVNRDRNNWSRGYPINCRKY